jgi:acetoin utilization protein AcuB
MLVRDLMTPRVQDVSADAPCARARGLMVVRGIRHLVVRQEGRIVGVVSQRDLGGPRGAVPPGRVEEVMSRHVVTVEPTATLRRAANLLRGHLVGCLPVVDDDRLVGIVTISDVLDLLGRGETHLRDRSKPYLAKRQGPAGKARERWPVRGRA